MNKTLKKILTSVVISATTLTAGIIITMLSFRLFGNLSINEMRILFSVDVISLLAVGSGFLIFEEKKNIKAKQKKAYEIRRARRIEQINRDAAEINSIIKYSEFAA